jgi:hypothetical protein
MPKRKTTHEWVILAVKATPDCADRFRRLVESEHRTVSQELRRLIDLRLAEADEKEAA